MCVYTYIYIYIHVYTMCSGVNLIANALFGFPSFSWLFRLSSASWASGIYVGPSLTVLQFRI